MQTEKNVSTLNVKVASEKLNDEKNIQKLFEKIKVPTISQRSESIYKDTEHLQQIDGGKKFRNQKRKQLEKFNIDFIQAVQANNKEKMQSTFETFKKFYSETYSKNDFTVSSVYSGTNENKLKYFETFFAGCKMFVK